MQIMDIMTSKVISVGQNEPVTAAARLLKRCNIGALPVRDDAGRLKGMVTDRDIVTRCVAAEADPSETKVSEIMSRGVVTAEPFDDVEKAVSLMTEDQVRRLPVTDNGKLVGIVTLCDLARRDECSMEAAEALSDISANFRRRV